VCDVPDILIRGFLGTSFFNGSKWRLTGTIKTKTGYGLFRAYLLCGKPRIRVITVKFPEGFDVHATRSPVY